MATQTSGGISDLMFTMGMRIDESSVTDAMRTLGDMKSKMSTTTFNATTPGGSTSSQDIADTEFAKAQQHLEETYQGFLEFERKKGQAIDANVEAIEGDMARALRRTLNIEDQINYDYRQRLQAIDAIEGATAQQTAALRDQADVVRTAARQQAISAGQIGGIGGAGLTGNRIQEIGRGFEDFTVGFSMAKTNIEGVAMGLRGSANNAAQLAASFSPMVGATVAIGASLATVIVPMVARWLYDTKAIEEAQEKANEKAEEWLKLREESNRQDLKRVNRSGGGEFMVARDENAVALKKQLEWELGELAKYEAERDKMKRRRLSIGLRNKTKEELAAEAGIADITPWIEDSMEKIKRNNEISRETSDAMEEKEQKRRDEDFDQKMKFIRKLEEAEAKASGSVAEMKLKHKREAEEFEKESMGRSEVDRARGRELMASRQQDELDKPFNDEIKRQEEQLDRLEKAEEKGRGIKERHAQEWADTMVKMEGASDEQRLRARLSMEKRHAREVASERLDAEIQANADQQAALQEQMEKSGNAAGLSAAMVSGTQAAESAINRALSGSQSVEGTMKSQLKELQKIHKSLEAQKKVKTVSL
jgi:hypothetical protein